MIDKLMQVLHDKTHLEMKEQEIMSMAKIFYSIVSTDFSHAIDMSGIKLYKMGKLVYIDIAKSIIPKLKEVRLIDDTFDGYGQARYFTHLDKYMILVCSENIKERLESSNLDFNTVFPFVLYHEFGHIVFNHIADKSNPDEIYEHEFLADAVGMIYSKMTPSDLLEFCLDFRGDDKEYWETYTRELVECWIANM